MKRIDRLTPRQLEILQLIALERLRSKEVAQLVGVSWKRIDNICAEAVHRLGALDRRDAVRIFLEEAGPSLGRADPGDGATGAPPLVFSGANFDDEGGVSEDNPDAVAYHPSPQQKPSPAPLHAQRRVSIRADLGEPGGSLQPDRLTGESGAGEGFCDGTLDGRRGTQERLFPSSDPSPREHPNRLHSSGGARVFSWIRGQATYSELSPSGRAVAILVVSGVIAMLTAWVVLASHSASVALAPWAEHGKSHSHEARR